MKFPSTTTALRLLLTIVLLTCVGAVPAWALTPNAAYTVLLSKVNSDGSVSDVSTTSGTTDATGKLSFSFTTGVPTAPSTNFVVLTVKDVKGNVAEKAVIPAPASGGTNLAGLNSLSNAQANALLTAMSSAHTDDPILVAFGLIIVRAPTLSASDLTNMAKGAGNVIEGSNGFVYALTHAGVTASQLKLFRERLVHNGDSGSKDLASFAAKFKNAVDNPSTATDDMAEAAGYLAQIFVDSGVDAGISPSLIIAAHDQAGVVADSDPDIQKVSAAFMSSVGEAMHTFQQRIKAIMFKKQYTQALTTLGATGSEVTRFNTAVQNMMAAYQQVDKQYGAYFQDPDTYVADHSTTETAVETAINTAMSNAFTAFQTGIASTTTEISDMKTAVAKALGVSVASLPPDLGVNYDQSGNKVNWPIPQTVAVQWVATVLQNGGALGYDWATVASAMPIPSNMTWLSIRNKFSSIPNTSFQNLMLIMQDAQIAQFREWDYYDTNGKNSSADVGAKEQYHNDMLEILGQMSGTTDGTTALSPAQKRALLRTMQQPST